jgi:hypothetical protein
MEMIQQPLVPGVKHRGETDPATEAVLGIGGKLLEGRPDHLE